MAALSRFCGAVPEKPYPRGNEACARDDLAAAAVLNGQSVDDLIKASDDFGAYIAFRADITDDGGWLFALAGD